ncbi:Glycosyltransferase involved in cell wall bisynthesis [Stutzerimonas xanthomarina]|uniref:Glycosyltransferase involved in cell wall bisynthesis n=3 Tax=Stutzerimonas xanthomarina TaxID=271420 RepID=A0A1M5P6U0_9GAMM|nr:glycosyltransferase [Stutzerimonas xanthomarina]SEH77381.1 Glycosyltransferase involved in cell wall bisynthesis [Stutzerimonas xanthomarina]SHG97496.1 Glycosyltransferase involved in cell wall bisynthesis [Stutzerimonas xanthomarina DSM 18231]
MAALLANAQVKRGHIVSVIYSARSETPREFNNLFDKEIKLFQVQMNSPKEKLISILPLRKTLNSLSPDKVFMHSSFAGFLGRLAALFTLNKTKFLYIPHCISFMRKDIGQFKKIVFITLEWIGSLKKSSYIACSKSEQLAIQAAIPFRKCYLVENALDFSSVPATSKSSLTNERTVITVGQIRLQKGPEHFAEIAKAVRSKDPSINFLWVGDGDPPLRKILESAGVRISGWASKEQVWAFLSEADLYLSTALWEGMPVSVLEAMSIGVPVVASDCAGNIDVVDHDKTGWLFNKNADAASLIIKAFSQKELSAEVAQNALRTAKERFNLNRYLKDMEALLSK